jgi:hypothetical protein
MFLFQQNVKDVNILLMGKDSHAKKLKIELKNPWKVTSECNFTLPGTDDVGTYDDEKEITRLSDLPFNYENMAALICNLLIGGRVNAHSIFFVCKPHGDLSYRLIVYCFMSCLRI